MTSTRRSLLIATAAAAAALPASSAHALPAGCAENADCLIEHVFGGSGIGASAAAAPATSPSVAVVGPQPAVVGPGRRTRVVLRVSVASPSVLEARAPQGPRLRRRVGAGVHTVRVSLGRRVRPGRHSVALSAVDAAGRRATAVAEVVVLASPIRIVRG